MSYSVTKSRVLQYIGIILIIGVFAGAYWYFQVFAGVKTNTGAAQPQGTGRLDSGLAGYWKLDDGSGTSATDSSTNGNTGTLTNGPTWTTGQIGGAVDFDGTNDSILVSTSGPIDIVDGENFTLSGWFNRDTFTSDHTIVAKRGSLASGNNGYAIYIPGTGDKLTFEVSDGTDEYLIESTSTFTATGWHHFSLVWDESSSSQTKLYINGAAESTTNTGTFGNINSINNAKSFTLGMLSDGGSNFDGKLDEIRFYDRALSPDEAGSLYRLTAPTGVDTGLKGYWSFNAQDMSGTTAYDRSGAGNTGTLTNGPTKTVGKAGQAVSFDGSNDYVDITDVTYNGEFTVAVWFNTSNNSQTATIFGDQSGGSGGGIKTGMTGGNFFVRPVSSSDNTIPVPTAGQWHYMVMTRDAANKIDFYVDGVGKRMFSDAAQSASFIPDKLGCNGSDGSQCFTGKLDEFRIYNRALTAAEIKGLYDLGESDKTNSSVSQPQGTGRLDSDLALYWKFDDGSGSTALDASVNSLDGAASGGPTWTTGQVGGAAYFDGSARFTNSSSGSIPLNPTDGESFTLAAWFNRDAFTGDDTIIAKRTGQSVTSEGYIAYIDGTTDKLTFEVSDDVDEYQLESVSTFTATGWYHFVVSWNDVSGATLYINGVAEAATVTGTFANIGDLTNSTGFAVGADSIAANLFNGAIDEARIYGRALVADEVFQLYRLTAPTGTDTGLKGYWSFNAQDMSGTTAYDRSGAGNTGALTNGPTKTIGKVGQALSFDGSDDYVVAPNSSSLNITGAVSVSVWLKSTDTDGCLISKSATTDGCFSSSATKVYELGILSSTLWFQIGNGTSAATVSGSASRILDNQWHHVTASWDGTTGTNGLKLYIDGVLTYQATSTISAIQNGGQEFLLSGKNGSYDYAGLMDEVRIYNRALTAAEIKSLYDVGESDKANSSVSQPQGTGRLDSGLAGYWKLDDGSGTSATDSSTNGITGTLNGTSTWGTGQIGSSVTFDGTDDYITAGDRSEFEMSSTNSLSFGGWFKVAAYPSGNRGFLITKGGSAGSGPSYEYELHVNGFNSNKLRFAIYNDSGVSAYMYIDSTTVPALDTWFHVMAIWDAQDTAIKLYYNGVLEATSTSTTSGIHNAKLSHFVIGKRDDDAESDHNGAADEVRVYSRALSGDEVAQLYRLATPTAIDTGLKGYWSFNGQDMLSSTTAADRSGAGNTGTLTGNAARAIGKIGQGMTFDGSGDYVDVGDMPAMESQSALTISTWINPVTLGNYDGIVSKYTSVSSDTTLNFGGTGLGTTSSLVATIRNGSDTYGYTATGKIVTGVWTHCVMVFDGSQTGNDNRLKIYINGVNETLTFNGTIPSTTIANSQNLTIGRTGSATDYFDGKVDEVRIYNRALTAAEVAALYNTSR